MDTPEIATAAQREAAIARLGELSDWLQAESGPVTEDELAAARRIHEEAQARIAAQLAAEQSGTA
jgi:hypothetical protein